MLKGDEVPIIKNAQELLGETAWKEQKGIMLKQYRHAMRGTTKAGRPYVEPKELDRVSMKDTV